MDGSRLSFNYHMSMIHAPGCLKCEVFRGRAALRNNNSM